MSGLVPSQVQILSPGALSRQRGGDAVVQGLAVSHVLVGSHSLPTARG
jgi:hypothetical protein